MKGPAPVARSAPPTAEVSVTRRGPVATIAYRSDDALLCAVGLRALRRAFLALDADPDLRVIVLTGDPLGERFLTALHPVDAGAMAEVAPVPSPFHGLVARLLPAVAGLLRYAPSLLDRVDPIRAGFLEHALLFDAVERSDKITVAAIGGDAFGGGLELALCFDLRVAVDRPTVRLAQPEALLGLVPGFGATWRMARLLGPARALDLQLLGRGLAPAEALRIGLVTELLPEADFPGALARYTDRLARRAPLAAAGVKRAIRAATTDPRRGPRSELRAVLAAWSSPEARDGLRAFEVLIEAERARPTRRSTAELLASIDAPS